MPVLLDNSVEMTVISAALAAELGLPISEDLALNVIGVSGK
jgi:hypothetical protein